MQQYGSTSLHSIAYGSTVYYPFVLLQVIRD